MNKRILYPILALGVLALVVPVGRSIPAGLAQVLTRPGPIVQEGDRHHAALVEHQARIRDFDAKHSVAIERSFGPWVRTVSESASQLFPELAFFSITWSESLPPEFKNIAVAGGPHGVTVAINTNTGQIEATTWQVRDDEMFSSLFIKHPIAVRSESDARRVWVAFCQTHHTGSTTAPIKKISDTEWHLGRYSYDQTISATDETETVVTNTHYWQVMVDEVSNQIVSWKVKVVRSNERTLSRKPKETGRVQ